MNTDIINNFIQYYISNFNDKNNTINFINLWKNYSTLNYMNKDYTEGELLSILNNLIVNYIIDINNIKVSFQINGDRRANILLNYRMGNNNEIISISQYIQLAYSNQKEFWIHSSLINSL
jgi:hypothetical protein